MDPKIIELPGSDWAGVASEPAWISALEAGKVLYFPHLAFQVSEAERSLLRPDIRSPKSRNISLKANGELAGAVGDETSLALLAAMIARYREQALQLVHGLLPRYDKSLRLAPTSYRPTKVESRTQSWRADDRRLHVDAFPSRPNYGERILRVFSNVNPEGVARVWRVGESFETIAKTFVPRAKPYSSWQAKALQALHVTKSLRSEYDHLMLQLHDGMKRDMEYQHDCEQITMPFAAGSTWVCFSDQTAHAVMSGQYMMEQTLHLPAAEQYDPAASPLGILQRVTGRALV